jgi:hypothetical protein
MFKRRPSACLTACPLLLHAALSIATALDVGDALEFAGQRAVQVSNLNQCNTISDARVYRQA